MTAKKQLLLFLLICLPISWALMGGANLLGKGEIMTTPAAYMVYGIACFMPMITAIVVCRLSHNSIRSLNLFPKLQGNGKLYAFAIISAVLISIWDTPLVTVLFAPSAASIKEEMPVAMIVFTILLYTAIGCLQSFILMGEEAGWMGLLFPKLEEISGTTVAIVITGLVRGCWHIPMLLQQDNILDSLLMLCVTNIAGGCLLVLLTKKSGSVVPAAVCHAITNTLPAVFQQSVVMDEAAYKSCEVLVNGIVYVPYLVFMGVCWFLLVRGRK